MEVYLVRHPSPCRSEGLCYGRNDVPVDPDVLAAAAASVRSLIPARVLRHAAMFTSRASRCLGLAREAADMWSYRAGGGESTATVAARWRGWCTRVAAQIGGRGLSAVAVTHAGLIRVALAGARDVGAKLLIDAPFGSVHRVDIDASEASTP
jgi:broad specificity phosphatase PhoE